MNLKAVLDKKNIILNLNIESKKRLIEFFASRLVDSCPEINEDDVLSNIYSRERIGNTYIGKNIYIPHCRVENLRTTKIIIATLKNSYYDDALDESIKIAVGVFFPTHVTETHVELLKQLALFFKEERSQILFRQATDVDTLYKYIVENQSE